MKKQSTAKKRQAKFFEGIADYQTKESYNYDKFSYYQNNREVSESHVNHLMRSMEKEYCFCPITVNEKLEIIDGQTRFNSCKNLGLPILYNVTKTYGINQIQLLNSHQKSWNLTDFMEFYNKEGIKSYKEYKFIKTKYAFDHGVTLAMVIGLPYKPGPEYTDEFKDGKLKIKDINVAIEIAEKITDFEKYFEHYRSRSFAFAIIKLLTDPGYNHKRMLSKISFQSAKLTKQTSIGHYIIILEKIFNFKNRTNVAKVRFHVE
jgi:hypothetical protein